MIAFNTTCLTRQRTNHTWLLLKQQRATRGYGPIKHDCRNTHGPPQATDQSYTQTWLPYNTGQFSTWAEAKNSQASTQCAQSHGSFKVTVIVWQSIIGDQATPKLGQRHCILHSLSIMPQEKIVLSMASRNLFDAVNQCQTPIWF